MFDRLEEVARRYRELEQLVSQPETAASPSRLRDVTREMSQIRATVEAYDRWNELKTALDENRELLEDADPEIQELARGEITALESEREALELELRRLLLPRDPNDEKNAVLEIRSGAGGDEAALFAGDLFRMYTRFAEDQHWQVEVLSMSQTDGGGLREVVAALSGKSVFRRLKHESGVHRVQRVPVTESQGRIHTSTVTVAVLPEAEEVDLEIDEAKDLRIDVYRSSGPGGQSVNTTDSAVRITHLPTGLVVTCQDEKSQHKNRARALKILRSRLYDQELQRQQQERADQRRGQVGSGDRSERIRTYNFPQSRITDHRAGLTMHKLERVLEGELGELLEGVEMHFETLNMAAADEAGSTP
jgi:peptide chain release factor 1